MIDIHKIINYASERVQRVVTWVNGIENNFAAVMVIISLIMMPVMLATWLMVYMLMYFGIYFLLVVFVLMCVTGWIIALAETRKKTEIENEDTQSDK